MQSDKSAQWSERVQALLEKYESEVTAGRRSLWDYTRHISRPPFDYCPFQCGFCDELREFDEWLAGSMVPATPVS